MKKGNCCMHVTSFCSIFYLSKPLSLCLLFAVSLYFGTFHSLEILKLYDQRIYLYKLCPAISKSLITLKHIQNEKKS